ncbi:MAG: ATPase, T2SS/T4P/T4SS family [Giesbergeria sp.]
MTSASSPSARWVATPTPSARGLRGAMRQAPDVIFVGEIRDFETALTALQASETGHLVLASLHSAERVSDTMERFLESVPAGSDQPRPAPAGPPAHRHRAVRSSCRSVDGQAHAADARHIENGGAVRDWIARRDVDHIHDYMSRGSDPNSTTFLRTILAAYEGGLISEEVAIGATGNETEFRRAARGVTS